MGRFVMADMDEYSRILGMKFTRNYSTETITQKGFALNILERLEMVDCNSVHMPEYGPELPIKRPEEKLLGALGVKLHQAIVGSVLYLAQVTRYAIYYFQPTDQSMQQTSGGKHDPC